MRRSAVVILLAVVLSTGYLYPHSAAAASSNMEVTAGIGLNVRSGPGMEYSILTAMPYGTVVSTGQWSGVWVQVTYNGITGWSHSGWLKNVDSAPTTTVSQNASNSSGASGPRCFWAHGGTVCAPDWIANTIYAAAARYGDDGPWLMRTAACESGFNPGAVGAAGEIGIFQFMWGTYYGNGGTGDIWNVYNQADRAAYMFSIGQSGQWTCA